MFCVSNVVDNFVLKPNYLIVYNQFKTCFEHIRQEHFGIFNMDI